MITGSQRAVVVWRDQAGFRPLAEWPANQKAVRQLATASETALNERQGVIKKYLRSDLDGEVFYHLAYPLDWDDDLHGVVAVEVSAASMDFLEAIMRQLQWGVVWFETFWRRQLPEESLRSHERLVTISKLVATYVENRSFIAAASAIVTELATELGCERVSLGFVEDNSVIVKALSHNANFDKKTNLVRAMGHAMDEARDQRAAVICPGSDPALVCQANRELLELSGAGSLCTLPIFDDEEAVGAIILEHHHPDFFDSGQMDVCEQAAMLLGPLLNLKRRDDRWLFSKIWDAFIAQAARLVGPGYVTRKLVAIGLAVVVACLVLIDSHYRVSADAVLEGWVQRSVAAPFDGYISNVSARAGDIVKSGDTLFRLDDKDLKLEQLKWSSQKRQIEKEYLGALVSHDKPGVGMLKARLDQADANLALIEGQLARTVARAPFDGVVVSGDLSQDLGTPVQKGQILMQVAPLEGYRIILSVDEMDIQELQPGQRGKLSLASMPGEVFGFEVERITPVATVDEGANVFRVEARLDEKSERLRPGMQGTGKVEVGERNLLWIWTHSFINWLRVWLWSWWP
jgi:multidrug efflux pump subunit AcrA (membrane-fusion protein)